MYHAIEMIVTIIKLILKLKSIEAPQTPINKDGLLTLNSTHLLSPSKIIATGDSEEVILQLKARIRCHIKSFLAQHTLFPVQFKFCGVDQITHLKTPEAIARASRLSGESRIIDLRVGGRSMQSGHSR